MICKSMNSFIVMDRIREAGKYKSAIHFEVGQPDVISLLKVKNTLKDAVDSDFFHIQRILNSPVSKAEN